MPTSSFPNRVAFETHRDDVMTWDCPNCDSGIVQNGECLSCGISDHAFENYPIVYEHIRKVESDRDRAFRQQNRERATVIRGEVKETQENVQFQIDNLLAEEGLILQKQPAAGLPLVRSINSLVRRLRTEQSPHFPLLWDIYGIAFMKHNTETILHTIRSLNEENKDRFLSLIYYSLQKVALLAQIPAEKLVFLRDTRKRIHDLHVQLQ